MTEDDALLRAICHDPDEDTVRLALADWLEECAEPHLNDFAHFIRAQIANARNDGTQPVQNEWQFMFRKYGSRAPLNGTLWLHWLTRGRYVACGMLRKSNWVRGFPRKIHAKSVKQYWQMVTTGLWFDRVPIMNVEVWGRRPLIEYFYIEKSSDGTPTPRLHYRGPLMSPLPWPTQRDGDGGFDIWLWTRSRENRTVFNPTQLPADVFDMIAPNWHHGTSHGEAMARASEGFLDVARVVAGLKPYWKVKHGATPQFFVSGAAGAYRRRENNFYPTVARMLAKLDPHRYAAPA